MSNQNNNSTIFNNRLGVRRNATNQGGTGLYATKYQQALKLFKKINSADLKKPKTNRNITKEFLGQIKHLIFFLRQKI